MWPAARAPDGDSLAFPLVSLGVEPPAGIEPATPSLPSMRGGFTTPCSASRVPTVPQAGGPVEGRVVRRSEVGCSTVSGKFLARPLTLVCAGSQGRGPFHLGGHPMTRDCRPRDRADLKESDEASSGRKAPAAYPGAAGEPATDGSWSWPSDPRGLRCWQGAGARVRAWCGWPPCCSGCSGCCWYWSRPIRETLTPRSW
jgi:hypothetical protein